MTITETEALEAIRSHHRTLEDELRVRVEALDQAAAADGKHERATATLVAYLAGEVLPHAEAEEQTLYRAARTHRDLADTVDEMIAEHRALSAAAGQLASAASATAAAEQAGQIAALFAAHVIKENEVLLPALLTDGEADLTALLGEMHCRTEKARQTPQAGNTPAADPQATVLSLLLEAAAELARAGHGDRACRLAASAWAALRETRPELAVRVTAALHGLARRAPARPASAEFAASREQGPGPGGREADRDLDVRDLAPAQRHESIFVAYQALAPGAGFVLVNDHDPKPLRYQFEAEHSGEFTWDSREAGPEVWRVRIGRPAVDGRAAARAGGLESGEDPELDVRELAHGKRHDVIFTAYQALRPGTGFVLVNDHDPLPLRYQFEAQYPAAFTWEYLQAGPAKWRVRIGRAGARPGQ
ncbi:MAG: DUF2249 domain-containing protein [Streptosporangiales bacterium]